MVKTVLFTWAVLAVLMFNSWLVQQIPHPYGVLFVVWEVGTLGAIMFHAIYESTKK